MFHIKDNNIEIINCFKDTTFTGNNPYLITGKSGSGKTTTILSLLSKLELTEKDKIGFFSNENIENYKAFEELGNNKKHITIEKKLTVKDILEKIKSEKYNIIVINNPNLLKITDDLLIEYASLLEKDKLNPVKLEERNVLEEQFIFKILTDFCIKNNILPIFEITSNTEDSIKKRYLDLTMISGYISYFDFNKTDKDDIKITQKIQKNRYK